MASSGKAGDISADITKLRRDVLKQALASLAAFIGSVNYSESFHMSAAAAGNVKPRAVEGTVVDADGRANAAEKKFVENPMYDIEKMGTSVEHANRVTRTYGVEIMSINIISATPLDAKLTTSLASGAVASAEALQAETAARGKANAVRIAAEAEAARLKIEAEGLGEAEGIKANAHAEGRRHGDGAAHCRAVRRPARGDGAGHQHGHRAREADGRQRCARVGVRHLGAGAEDHGLRLRPEA